MPFHFLFNIVSFGGILVFLFMWLNQNFNDNYKRGVNVPILSYGHLAKSRRSCGNPYVHIVYQGKEKELIFPCGIEIEKYSIVHLETVNGFFGFDVITSKTLSEKQW